MPTERRTRQHTLQDSISEFLATVPVPFIGDMRHGMWLLELADLLVEYIKYDPSLEWHVSRKVMKLMQAMMEPYANKSWVDTVYATLPMLANFHEDVPAPGGEQLSDTIYVKKSDQVSYAFWPKVFGLTTLQCALCRSIKRRKECIFPHGASKCTICAKRGRRCHGYKGDTEDGESTRTNKRKTSAATSVDGSSRSSTIPCTDGLPDTTVGDLRAEKRMRYADEGGQGGRDVTPQPVAKGEYS